MKFFNQSAIVNYVPNTGTVCISFGDTGEIDEYWETLRIAEGIAQMHRSRAYLIEKKAFTNITLSEYGSFLMQWISRLDSQWKGPQSVALRVPPPEYAALQQYAREYGISFYLNVSYEVCSSYEEGVHFLNSHQW